MSIETTNLALGQAAGLGTLSNCSDAFDASISTQKVAVAQAETHECLLEIKRTSIWNIAATGHEHLLNLLDALAYGDYPGIFAQGGSFVRHAHAIEHLLVDLKNEVTQ